MRAASPPPPRALRIRDAGGFLAYARDLLVLLDESGRVADSSASVADILGYDRPRIVGMRFLAYVHPADRPQLRRILPDMLASGSVSRVDLRVRSAGGAWIPLRWTWSAPRGGRLYGVGRDRSEDLRNERDASTRERAELRLRTATELHDGVLQTLTATSLQLEVARRLIGTDPQSAVAVLAALGEAVAAEQRELRFYVDEIKGLTPGSLDGPTPLSGRVANMLHRIQGIWGVRTALHTDLAEPFDLEIERQILRLIQECVVNAVRHGKAGAVSVCLAQVGQQVHLHVSDNGRGFPFFGTHTHEDLHARKLGPLSVKRRVASVGGRISIESAAEGAVVSLSLPIPAGVPR